MGRILLLATLVYGYGDPGFDGHRPASFDSPLRNLHRTVNTVASDVQRILVTIDNKANVIVTLPTLGDKLRRIGDALARASAVVQTFPPLSPRIRQGSF